MESSTDLSAHVDPKCPYSLTPLGKKKLSVSKNRKAASLLERITVLV